MAVSSPGERQRLLLLFALLLIIPPLDTIGSTIKNRSIDWGKVPVFDPIQMFAATLSGAPSTPSEEIVVFEELEEAESDQEETEHVEEGQEEMAQNIGKNFFEESKVVEAQTEYDIAVFKRLLWDIT